MVAIEKGHSSIAEELILTGADPFLTDKDDANILHSLLTTSGILEFRNKILQNITTNEDIRKPRSPRPPQRLRGLPQPKEENAPAAASRPRHQTCRRRLRMQLA